MSKLSVLMARYDRTVALLEGDVRVPGVDLEITEESDDPARQRLGLSGKYDVWEAYAGRYLLERAAGRLDFVAIPVFPKRTFRHSAVYVRRDGPVRGPTDLVGRRVGLQHWSTTAALWAKGILAEEHGVDLASIDWVQTSPDESPWRRPAWLRLEQAPPDVALPSLLGNGDIDAAITSQPWVPYEHPGLAFLFPDYRDRERDYFHRTHVFPIMHVLVVRASILDDDPSIGSRLFDAWTAAKDRCLDQMGRDRLVVSSMWFQGLLEEERAAAGSRDTYPYGLRRSRHEVAKLLAYAVRQGLVATAPSVEELFHSSTHST